jgi:hypothetical protein
MVAAWVDTLYPGGSRQVTSGDSFPYKTPPCIFVMHTTEGSSYPSYAYNKSPHATVNPAGKTWRQHRPLNQPAWSLQANGGVSTNSWGAIQLEIIGYAKSLMSLPADQVDYVAGLIKMLCAQSGVETKSSVTFDDSSAAGTDGSVRLSANSWYNYRGILGHQHVPTNDHWDPGAIDINMWLNAINGTAPIKFKGNEVAFVTRYGSSGYHLVTGDRITAITQHSAERWAADGGFMTALDNTDVTNLQAALVSEAAQVTTGDVTVAIDYDKMAEAFVKALKSVELNFGTAD